MPGVADRGDGLDVVPVAVRREDAAHTGLAAHVEQQLVLVRGVEQHRVAGPLFERTTNTLFSNGPTTSLSIRTSVSS